MKPTFLFLLTLAGCVSSASAPATLHDREWRLVEINGSAASNAALAVPTIRFESSGRVVGNTGCNSLSGAFTASGGELGFGMLAQTKRGCAAREGNELERAYNSALSATRSYRIKSGRLELLDADGMVVARFE